MKNLSKVLKTWALCLIFIHLGGFVKGQCSFTPTILGNVMLCPNDTNVLFTQTYSSYQWYKRLYLFGSWAPIAGAVSQSITVDQFNDSGFEFMVEVSQGTCTAVSDSVLVDGYVFSSPTVLSMGNFTFNPVTSQNEVCIGDTIQLIGTMPYDTLYAWTLNGNVIPGATTPTLNVTTSGIYTAIQMSPKICPNFSLPLGVNLEFVFISCLPTGLPEIADKGVIQISPNPTQEGTFRLKGASTDVISELSIVDLVGNTVFKIIRPDLDADIHVRHLNAGIYLVMIRYNNQTIIKRLVIGK